ncbi:hypothetical protein ASE57_16735 [Sphingomonas sp. Leaf11]|nr:hypothetical protein ASE57_16735 [Sphingomonas sp. Leaf11]
MAGCKPQRHHCRTWVHPARCLANHRKNAISRIAHLYPGQGGQQAILTHVANRQPGSRVRHAIEIPVAGVERQAKLTCLAGRR